MNKLGKSLALSCIAGLLLISCSESGPEETFELMRQEACEGDVEGFFSYVDESQMRKTLYESYFSDDEKPEDPTEAIAQYIVNFIILHFGQYINLDYMWELARGFVVEDIQLGESSSYCTNKLIGPHTASNNLIIESADGEKSTWEFKNQWGKWKLVWFSEYPEDTEDNDRITGETDKTLDPRGPAPEQGGQPYDFRKTRWGMSIEEVKRSENSKPTDGINAGRFYFLHYVDTVVGLKVELNYTFEEHLLINAKYIFNDNISEAIEPIEYFNRIKDSINKEYGDPRQYSEVWSKDQYKDKPELHNKALYEGDVSYAAFWETPNTVISLMLFKNIFDGGTNLIASYSRRSIKDGSDTISADGELNGKEHTRDTSHLEKDQNYDFRKTHWGMSKNEVRKNETTEFIGETDDALIYKEKIGGLDSKLVYMFEDGKLRNSAYKFENEYSEVEDYINDYEKLKDAYTKKYGEPYSDKVRWTNDTFKDDPSMLGQALIEGHVSYITQWSLPETNVILSLYKDEDEISLMAAYRGFKITNENTETLDIESGEIEEKL